MHMPLDNGRCEAQLYVSVVCFICACIWKFSLTLIFSCYSVWMKLISLFEFTCCSVSWLKLDSLVTCYCVKLVFLAPTYKLGSSWKAIKYQLFYDESFPERPFESKVFSRIILISCSHLQSPVCCVVWAYCVLYLVLCCVCAFVQG